MKQQMASVQSANEPLATNTFWNEAGDTLYDEKFFQDDEDEEEKQQLIEKQKLIDVFLQYSCDENGTLHD